MDPKDKLSKAEAADVLADVFGSHWHPSAVRRRCAEATLTKWEKAEAEASLTRSIVEWIAKENETAIATFEGKHTLDVITVNRLILSEASRVLGDIHGLVVERIMRGVK